MIFVRDDWAEDHHDIHVMDFGAGATGVTAATGRTRGPRCGPISAPRSTRCTCSRSARTWTGSSPAGNAKCFRKHANGDKPASIPI